MNLLSVAGEGILNYIFGAGNFGIELREDFKINNIEINGFVVSPGYKNVDFVNGVSVFEEQELIDKVQDMKVNIFIAVYNHQDRIKKQLQSIFGGNVNIVGVSYENDVAELKSDFMKNYFLKKDIDIMVNPLVLNGVKFENPFEKSNDYRLSWCVSAADIVFPMLFDDDSLAIDGNYEYDNVILEKGDIVIDCGANVGQFSVIASHKGCKVYSFEPMDFLQKYIADNNNYTENEITIVPYALSTSRGKAIFYEQEGNPLGGTLLNMESKSNETRIEIDTISLDEFVRENGIEKVGFVKADIEGAERYMLAGATEVLQIHEPKLSLCTYHFADDPQIMEKIILEANPRYVIVQGKNKMYAYVPK